ncbi:MAG TPA: ankyrin repeat domain-containing protein [Candidatus Ozemobacteraceae bacterium]|mgnify:CR=1 FL=1|nr:ankyrin repeat domain-containing protein [Candidatus Ozemobacteraceae bacterium]HQG29249.1 ankyrin repeat domain-containing protein [Candidatus Ozemobacteraceae bacterium]
MEGSPKPNSDPEKDLFARDERGRTPLFRAAEQGLKKEVEEMLDSLRGTGFCPPRLGLIEIRDADGFTAADAAERNGHAEIAKLLRTEAARMEFFE